MADDFQGWLQDELDQRGWSGAELARRSGVSQAMVSLVLAGQRQPGFEFCEGVALAFKMPPDLLLRKAGLLSSKPEMDEKSQEIIHLYQMMNNENQNDLVEYARMKLQRQERNDKNKRPPARQGSG